MTTGLIFAAIYYFVAVGATAIGAAVYTDGDPAHTLSATGLVAKIIGPALVAPLGFVFGFFREKSKQRKEELEKLRQKRAEPVQMTNLDHTTTVRPIRPPQTAMPVKPMSDEVREFLKQTSKVDLKGIREFVEETRYHSLSELQAGMKAEQQKEKKQERPPQPRSRNEKS